MAVLQVTEPQYIMPSFQAVRHIPNSCSEGVECQTLHEVLKMTNMWTPWCNSVSRCVTAYHERASAIVNSSTFKLC
jgi:hypothetical protein